MPKYFLFFFNDTATTEIYTLSLHDALPICLDVCRRFEASLTQLNMYIFIQSPSPPRASVKFRWRRSEEHTSELQSQSNLVCRLLLEKKKIYWIHPPPSA